MHGRTVGFLYQQMLPSSTVPEERFKIWLGHPYMFGIICPPSVEIGSAKYWGPGSGITKYRGVINGKAAKHLPYTNLENS